MVHGGVHPLSQEERQCMYILRQKACKSFLVEEDDHTVCRWLSQGAHVGLLAPESRSLPLRYVAKDAFLELYISLLKSVNNRISGEALCTRIIFPKALFPLIKTIDIKNLVFSLANILNDFSWELSLSVP